MKFEYLAYSIRKFEYLAYSIRKLEYLADSLGKSCMSLGYSCTYVMVLSKASS